MKFVKNITVALAVMSVCCGAMAQRSDWQGNGWSGEIAEDGTIRQIVYRHDNGKCDTVPFFLAGNHSGPRFYLDLGEGEVVAEWTHDAADDVYNSSKSDAARVIIHRATGKVDYPLS